MIITDDFVYIHYPKTGGTFVTHVLKRLYQYKKKYKLLTTFLPKRIQRRLHGFIQTDKKHGTCDEIPELHRNKPILATIRNPYDRYVSHYEFGWWKKYPEDDFYPFRVEKIQKKYPHFPDLSFEEYINLWNAIWLPATINNSYINDAESFGLETFDFITFFFRNAQEVFTKVNKHYDSYIASQRYKVDMYNVHFIRTDRLNEELYDFLLNMGWNRNEVEFVLDLEKIFPKEGGRSREQVWEKYYTRKLKSIIRRKERLVFDIFPQFDV